MNEFEYLRQMRDLREPVAPARDLWAAIDKRLGMPAVAAPPRTSWSHRFGLAAMIAGVAIFSGTLGLHLAGGESNVAAVTRWQASDPRLAGASVELNAAHLELNQAMRDSPDSPALRRLLDRTERQQDRLRHLERQAG